MNDNASRAKRQAGGGPLERRVRRPASLPSAPTVEVTRARPASGWPPRTNFSDGTAFKVEGAQLPQPESMAAGAAPGRRPLTD